METCDVLVVGGGPAGSTCAWTLRQAGADVLVIDQATFPRDKVCAGWITPPVIDDAAARYRRRTPSAGPSSQSPAFATGVIGRPHDVARATTSRSVTASAAASSTTTCCADRGARLRLGTPVKTMRPSGRPVADQRRDQRGGRGRGGWALLPGRPTAERRRRRRRRSSARRKPSSRFRTRTPTRSRSIRRSRSCTFRPTCAATAGASGNRAT